MTDADAYRRKAEACFALAATMQDDQKARWLAEAQKWMRLAEFSDLDLADPDRVPLASLDKRSRDRGGPNAEG